MTDELTQASIYGRLIRQAACDSDIAEVSFFGFQDDGLRTGFQAGLRRADGSPRPAAAAVQAAIAEMQGGCAGAVTEWAPGEEVVGAAVAVGALASAVTARIAAGEDARALVCVRDLDGVFLIETRPRCRAAADPRTAARERRRAGAHSGGRPGGGDSGARSRGEPDPANAPRSERGSQRRP